MKITLPLSVLAFLLAAILARAQGGGVPPLPTQLDASNLAAFVALARPEFMALRENIVAQNLPLTIDEAAKFWPLHRAYMSELSQLVDRRVVLIERFAQSYQTMTDKEARALGLDHLELEAQRTALKRKYFKEFTKVIPAIKVVRFFQIDGQLTQVVDLQVTKSLPLIQ
jgi:hypothetical protein